MAATVYKWPPIGVLASEWTIIDPTNVSRSIATGARYVSAHERRRRAATIDASAIGPDHAGAGYLEMLKDFLKGGEDLVRLYSCPINRRIDAGRLSSSRQSRVLSWLTGGDPLDWTSGGDPLYWYTGPIVTGVTGTDADGWPIVTVSNLPPNIIVARPAEWLTAYEDNDDTTGSTARVVTVARSDASGEAVIRLKTALAYGGRINIGVQDTGVFEALEMPRSSQPLSGSWSYQWRFLEVFADEVGAGGFTEIDPWTQP